MAFVFSGEMLPINYSPLELLWTIDHDIIGFILPTTVIR